MSGTILAAVAKVVEVAAVLSSAVTRTATVASPVKVVASEAVRSPAVPRWHAPR